MSHPVFGLTTTAQVCAREGCAEPRIRYYPRTAVWRHIEPDYGQPVILDHAPEPDARPGRWIAGVWVADEDGGLIAQQALDRAHAAEFSLRCGDCDSPFHFEEFHRGEDYDPVADMHDDDGGEMAVR